MSRALKGTLALVAAALLLLTAYGTYALWSDSETLDGGTVSSGELALAGTTPGQWRDASAGAPGTPIDITTFTIVPGDVLTYTLTRTVEVTGNNLVATLAADPASVTGDPDLLADVDVTTAIVVGGTTQTAITAADDGQEVVVTVTFDFDETSGNETQLESLDLSALELTLSQNPR